LVKGVAILVNRVQMARPFFEIEVSSQAHLCSTKNFLIMVIRLSAFHLHQDKGTNIPGSPEPHRPLSRIQQLIEQHEKHHALPPHRFPRVRNSI
jgi:hypothetical protein